MIGFRRHAGNGMRGGVTARADPEPAHIFAATHIASMTLTDSESGTASATVRVKITR